MRIRSFFLLALSFGWGHSTSAEILYSVTDLGTPPGFPFSTGVAINNLGEVAGNASSDFSGTTAHPFLYSNGQWTDLGTLGGERTVARGLNDSGQVVGSTIPSSGNSHAFLYSNGQLIDLGLSGGATGINNAGQMIGSFGIYSNGGITPLPKSSVTAPLAINNVGQVTGFSDIFDQSLFRPFLYSNGQSEALGALPGDRASQANAINNAGQIVGWSSNSFPPQVSHPFLYSNGQMVDLNDLIDPALGITWREAQDINDKGQIVANGFVSGRGSVFLLTPVPEPSTFALFGLALVGLCAWSRHRTHVFR